MTISSVVSPSISINYTLLTNEIEITISENENISINNDNIKFKFYNHDFEKCRLLQLKNMAYQSDLDENNYNNINLNTMQLDLVTKYLPA